MAKSNGGFMTTIEIINSLAYTNFPGIAWQIEQVRLGKSYALWLATPHEDATYLVRKLGLDPTRVYDMYAQRYLENTDDKGGLWWTDLPVPDGAQFRINGDGTKDIISRGHVRAHVRWFNDSKRLIQAVVWQDPDGKIDYKDIYRRDGKLFAKQYFSEGELLESDFYFGQSMVQVSDFYFENHRNFVYAYDQKYQEAESYIASIASKWPRYTFNTTQLGREIAFSPQNTVLTLVDDVLDGQGRVRHDVAAILNDPTHKIQQVRTSQRNFDILKSQGITTHKVRIVIF
ncbi:MULTISPECIES: glycosyl transferase [Leuconostoc]|uniref:Phosphoglycerate kinase n=2 Tax=Leuconostoc kimchii TaxID=136609 RepID=D5T3H6_LEUKI|nr:MULTISPECIES: glycosyl transferase [Leuconostoc]ADG40825.1 phosphoglycerate kinase [Leuconostoc kimchii IMSNU 11154]AEJ31199.1 phosphoglycerate kinase [Leuconostoc sp. C2]QBR48287.1 glycosyltransferase [Leuconostoc kimchii]